MSIALAVLALITSDTYDPFPTQDLLHALHSPRRGSVGVFVQKIGAICQLISV